MVLWITPEMFHNGQDICEIEVDGSARVIVVDDIDDAIEDGHVYWLYVAEGNEVGTWGMLLEHGVLPRGWAPRTTSRDRLHVTARRSLIRRATYPRVFLSYRRDDADAFAGRVHEALTRSLGEEIFMDQFGIRGGEVFSWTIQQAVVHAQVMIVLMGSKWLTITNGRNTRRLDGPLDFVRREVTAAIDRGLSIVPVLLPGATVPERQSLPDEMQGLEELQALELSPRHWEADIAALVEAVRQHLSEVR